MHRFFGGKKNKGVTTEEAEKQLQDTTEMLYKKQTKLENDIEKQLKLAKQYGTKNKKR